MGHIDTENLQQTAPTHQVAVYENEATAAPFTLTLAKDGASSLSLNGQTIPGLMAVDTWDGLTKYSREDAEYLIALDSAARVLCGSPALIEFLGLLPPQKIDLRAGEVYVGVVEDESGQALHHLILLPGQADDIAWPAATKWAESIGGALPSRAEQRLLFEKCKAEFQQRWYWSGEQHAAYADYAWGQGFYGGYQGYGRKAFKGRARAIRHYVNLIIQ